jgi:hypothetical protein
MNYYDLSLSNDKAKAEVLRKKLIDFGYKYILYCDTEDRGIFKFNYYYLTKEDTVSDDNSCSSILIPLCSDEAMSIIERAMLNEIIIPDITAIDIYSDANHDPIISHEKTNKERAAKFQQEKIFSKRARQLQQKLLDQGYKTLELCDDDDDGGVFFEYYNLSKEDEIAKPDSCFMYTKIPVESVEAFQILFGWVKQTIIYPDPRNI